MNSYSVDVIFTYQRLKGLRRMRTSISMIQSDQGMTTAEYAVGTCAAAGLGGILIKILTSSDFYALLLSVLKQAFGFLFS